MALKIDTGPQEEPLALEDVKLHARVDHDDEDDLLRWLIAGAREHVEQTVLNRALITQTWNLYLDCFPAGRELRLPLPPLQSVAGIYYTPEGGQETEFAAANYAVDAISEPGRVVLQRDAMWPGDELAVVNGVRVEFVAGYGDTAADVPQPIRQALLMLIGDLYENREETIVVQGLLVQRLPFGVQALLMNWRIPPELSAT